MGGGVKGVRKHGYIREGCKRIDETLKKKRLSVNYGKSKYRSNDLDWWGLKETFKNFHDLHLWLEIEIVTGSWVVKLYEKYNDL